MSSSRYTIQPQDFQKINATLLYISKSRYEGDWQSIPHTHHFAELIYVVDGRGQFLMDGNITPITPGDLIIAPPNLEHTEQSDPLSPLEYIVLGIDGVTFQNDASNIDHLICSYKNNSSVADILRLLLNEAESGLEGSTTVCQNLLEILLIRIMRMQALVAIPYTSSKIAKEFGIIKRYLDSNYADPITLEQLASLAHMSKYYLVHAFTKCTGLSPISYLNKRRLEISKELLSGTNYSIAQIASSVGFSSQSYFSQVFKKEIGISPVEYRKSSAKSY